MKIIHRFVLIALIVGLLLSGKRVIPVAAMAFPNGGFESLPTGWPNDWYWPSSNWVRDGSMAHSGSYSARVARSTGSATATLWSAKLPVQPSTVYTLSYWLRTQNATFYPRVVLYQYNKSGVQTGPYLVAYPNIGNGTNGWKVVNYRFQTMPLASELRVRIYLSTDTTGTFWFDDFSIEQGAAAHFPYQAGFPVAGNGGVLLSSPTVADINNDGNNELLNATSSSVSGWNKAGIPLPGFPLITGDKLIIGQIAVADLDKDGKLEILAGTQSPTAEGQCRVFAWRSNGALLSGWPQRVAWETQYSANNCWITSVVVADIDGDHNPEILASTTNNGAIDPYANIATPNLYAWHTDGTLVAGNWPNWQTTAGIYGALAAGDLSGDGKAEVIVGRDYLYLNAYGSNGQSLPGWPIRTFVNRNNGNYDTEQRIHYTNTAPTIADLDGDGKKEIIIAGHVSGPGNKNVIQNSGLLVLEPDGTRKPGWETAALGNGILALKELPWQGPAVADLNGDGQLEIVVATEDGWIRAYKTNKTVLWAFNYTQGATLFAGDPVIGDIDGDGALEIVFGTYVPEVSCDKDGPVGLWALKANGTVSPGFPLVIPTPGVRSAPTLADLDGDGKLEILAATKSGQVLVWDTSTPYNPARLPWPTGRHDLQRSATYTWPPNLNASVKFATPLVAHQGETSTFTIHLASPAPITDALSLVDMIPAGLSYVPGTLAATSGDISENSGVIQWSGTLPDTLPVDITYEVIVDTAATQVISSTSIIDAGTNGRITRTGYLYANGFSAFLPMLMR